MRRSPSKTGKRIPLAALLAGIALLSLSHPARATTELTSFVPSDGATNDDFGSSVDVDGNTAVAGAPFADIGGNSAQGAVYVFEKDGNGVWTETIKIVAADGVAFDQLGYDVAISGDWIVAGAEEAPVGPNASQGVAYVFERDTGGPDNWGLVKKLEEPTSIGNTAEYGHSVAIDGDVVVIGAPKAESATHGRAYVYYRNAGGPDNWGKVAELQDDIYDTNAGFGTSVAIDGDYLVAGAELLDHVQGTFENEGGAYVFARNEGGADAWGQVAKLLASNAAGSDHAGGAVALDGTTVLVGATAAEPPGSFFSWGQVYVYTSLTGAAGTWAEVSAPEASDGMDFASYGVSVALSGDTALVGAHAHANGVGQAYVLARDEGGADNWGEIDQLTASDGGVDDFLGYDVATDGTTILVGGFGHDAGKVYVYDAPGGGPTATPLLGTGPTGGSLELAPARPNPFRASTTISFRIASAGRVELAVFDVAGRRIATLTDREFAAGSHSVTWEADDTAPGVYFYRATAAGRTAIARGQLVR